ncbi:MAG: DNA primase [Candidatus Schekmanbacteria bacterium]|nr:DNA primase [Candidatus Schekmanbacteria bacterium]
MQGNIAPQIIEEIRQRSDIVDVISRYVNLKQKGKNHYGLCPFHTEKTPSFAVNPEKQIFHCFGCGAGGDVFGFLIKKENLNFVEAVKLLAGQCGVNIPQKDQDPQVLQKLQSLQKLYEINQQAAEYFQNQLNKNPKGRQALLYLEKRGISADTRKQFKLGFATDSWDGLLQHLTAGGVSPALLLQAGLIIERQDKSGCFDRFRERVMFPIYDHRERLIGFGGRCFDAEKNPPKYMNSPETPVYHKGDGFYGLNWSLESIRREQKALIVEGYLDYISLYQAGITNVVASLGTAFTRQQAQLIGHYARELVLFFDSDEAGVKAATRCFPIFLDSKLKVKVAQVPVGYDPDSFVHHAGAIGIRQRIEQAVPLLEFVLKETLKGVKTDSVEGQIEAANLALPILAQVPNALERNAYLTRIAHNLKIKEQLLFGELSKALNKRQRAIAVDKDQITAISHGAEALAQQQILSLMLNDGPYLNHGLENLSANDFSDPDCQELFLVLQNLEAGKRGEINYILQQLSSERAKGLVTKAGMQPEEMENPQQVFQDCLQTLSNFRLRRQMQELRAKALDDREALAKYNDLMKQLKCS